MLNKYVMVFWEEITKRIDKGSPVDIIYLDFQKGFDVVPHQILLLKLKAHGYYNNGPNTDPCGTPIETDFQFETSPSTITRCLLSVSHPLYHGLLI